MARWNVPEFGNWEKEGDVPYTVCFDNARKKRGEGKMINPNDPQEYPQIAPPSPSPKPRTGLVAPVGRGPVGSASPEHKERGRFRQSSENVGHGSRGPRTARPGPSPLHPNYNEANRGGGSPAREGRSNSGSQGHNPVRSRVRPARGDQSTGKGAAIPKFGAWNENDPSAENFTDVFNQVRYEKKGGGVRSPLATPNRRHIRPSREPKKCCFPWW